MSPPYFAAVFLFLLLAAPFPPTVAAKGRHASTAATSSYRRISWASNLTLLGSASFLPGAVAVALTTNSSDGIGAGRALFSVPVRFLLPSPDPSAAPAQASFLTRFTVRIAPSPSYGDGLAFILTSSPTFLGDSNGYMGLYPSVAGDLTDVSTVAVELDTHRDVALRDPNGNHVALDAGSIFSLAYASPGVDLKGGLPVTAWVEYRAAHRRLRAWLSYSPTRRPKRAALSVDIDLYPLLRTDMYVGFAASNGEGIAVHVVDIDTWIFRTFIPADITASPPPKIETPSPPVSLLPAKDQPKHHKKNLAVKILGGFLGFTIAIGFAVWLVRHCCHQMCGQRGCSRSEEGPASAGDNNCMLPLEIERSR